MGNDCLCNNKSNVQHYEKGGILMNENSKYPVTGGANNPIGGGGIAFVGTVFG